MAKNPPASAGDAGDVGWIPGLEGSPGGGNGNPLQYSCLDNPMDRGAWRVTGQGVTQTWPQLSDWAKRTPRRRGPYHWEQLKAHFNRLKQKFFTRDVNSRKKIKLRSVHYSQSPAWHGPERQWTQLSSMGSSHAHLSIVQQVSLEPKEMDDIIRVLYIVCWRRKWQPTPVFLPGESQGQRSLVGCCPWDPTESDTTEAT